MDLRINHIGIWRIKEVGFGILQDSSKDVVH